MATDLQINVLTVRKAYKQLETKGYIRIEQGKGAYIYKRVKKDFKPIPYKWQQSRSINVMRSQYAMNKHRKYYDFSQAILYPRLLPNPFWQTKCINCWIKSDVVSNLWASSRRL